MPAKFGIWSKTWGAGRPVPWSSKVQETKVRFTGSRSVATRFSRGTGSLDRASLRTRRRQETDWPGLNGPPPERFSLAGLSCTNGPLTTNERQELWLTFVGPAV